MLTSIFDGREKSRITLITDSLIQSGIFVWLHSIRLLSNRCDYVHVLCFDNDPETYSTVAPFNNRVIWHNGAQDPCNWITQGDVIAQLSVASNLVNYIDNHCKELQPNHHVAIAMDTVSPLIRHSGDTRFVCQKLHQLVTATICGNTLEQVVICLHSDMHDSATLSLLSHVASTVIRVTPTSQHMYHSGCNILHKSSTGKIFRHTEDVSFSEDYLVIDCAKVMTKKVYVNNQYNENDPAANLTFNLSLSQAEHEAREEVVLPHVHNVQTKGIQSNGEIYYEPDDIDDFDEEDPDNDLYI